jgi:exonuclease SbcD
MIDNQTDILQKIVALACEHKPDAVLIAGDVYDKATPIVDAVKLLDWLLVGFNELGIAVYLVSGNHDSAERMAFGAELLKHSGVHIVPSYKGQLEPHKLADEHGELNVWMMPYLKPILVRDFFPDETVVTYSDAVRAALGNIQIDTTQRNILVAHQFVTGAKLSEGSEELLVGGSENIDGSLFDAFDYVALGHIHRPQSVGRKTMRYCGTPLKYALSEIRQQKSVTVVDVGKKGSINITELPLVPERDMKEVRGAYNEIMSRDYYSNLEVEKDYFYIFLTDEHDEPDALAKLRNVYKNIVSLRYDNKRTNSETSFESIAALTQKSPSELFGKFFADQNGQPLSAKQEKYVQELFASVCEEMKT